MSKALKSPFVLIWKLVGTPVETAGRLLAVVIGLVLVILGVVLSLTIVGAIIGVPLIVTGGSLFITRAARVLRVFC
jgi:hypothetical protein